MRRMRESVSADFGVEIPGVHVRGDEAYLARHSGRGRSKGTYIMLLKEVPLVSGNVPADKLYVEETADTLKSKRIAAEGAVDPRSGAETSWVSASDRKRLTELGYGTRDPIDYILEHLRAVIEHNLVDFMGVQETHVVLKTQCPEKLGEIEKLSAGLASLANTLRALLAEQVPITPLPALVDRFLALAQKARNLPTVVETIRRLPEFRARLPGENTVLYSLDDGLEAEVRKSLYTADPVPVLAMTPKVIQEVLTAMRGSLRRKGLEAIVVSDPGIRAHLRKLVESEFPRLFVLARDELLEERARKPQQRIALE